MTETLTPPRRLEAPRDNHALRLSRNDGTPRVAIPVAGVLNEGHGRFSTAAVHHHLLRRALRGAGFRVEFPVVQPLLGVVGNMERGYHRFENYVDQVREHHGEGTRAVLIGHSFGGLYPLRYYLEHGAENGIDGVITLGSPHGDMRHLHGVPSALRRYEPYTHRCDEIAEFSAETFSKLPDPATGYGIVFAGAAFDQIVPLRASVPRVEGPRQVVFTQFGNRPRGYRSADVIPAFGIEHNGLLVHPAAQRFVVQSAIEMASVGDVISGAQNLLAAAATIS